MRYRVFDVNGLLTAYPDRDSFYQSFRGADPNHPVDGIIRVKRTDYRIFDYKESCSNNSTENEFHETETDWFANLLVKTFHCKDSLDDFRDAKIRSYLNPIL